jgi:hypothetical protein
MPLAKQLNEKKFDSVFLNFIYSYQKRIRDCLFSEKKMSAQMLEVDQSIITLYKAILTTESEMKTDL